MNVKRRREQVFSQMEDNTALVLFSGVPMGAAFEPSHNFFYLTGLRRENMALVMTKAGGACRTALFIEEADPQMVRWTGKRVSPEEARETAQPDEVIFIKALEGWMNTLLHSGSVKALYFDCFRSRWDDLPDYNAYKAREFAEKYPGAPIYNAYPLIARLRMQKDGDEVGRIKEAIRITDKALQNVMLHLHPGKMEYQAQADFEYTVHDLGAPDLAFPTIAGSGMNGTMLHYGTNRDVCRDGDLLLLDLGAKYEGYCADITRTYPVNGKFSPRQRQVYDIVLKANRAVAAAAKAGMTLRELNDLCSQVLAQGCMELGLIREPGEIGKYYMHGVSHHLGIDVHDVTLQRNAPLQPGNVISDEPGLYIDEWGIGIRIEDDLLIGENGCEVLSAQVIREPEEIEAFMAQAR